MAHEETIIVNSLLLFSLTEVGEGNSGVVLFHENVGVMWLPGESLNMLTFLRC